MNIEFYSDKNVTIKQLVDAGARCGIEVTKNTIQKDTYTMKWNVDDYEHYATEVLKVPETQKAFRERIKPRGDRFVMERDFTLVDGSFSYCYWTSCDDAGIVHRLFNELDGISLITLDEYHQSTYEENEREKEGEMSQDQVALSIEIENSKEEEYKMENNTSTPDERYDLCIKIFYSIENELKDKLDVEDDWYLQHDISPDLLYSYIEEIIPHDNVDDIAYDLLVREYINREIAFGINSILKKIGKETGIENELTEVFALLESLQKQGEILGSIYDEIYSRPIMFEVAQDSLLYGDSDE